MTLPDGIEIRGATGSYFQAFISGAQIARTR